MIKNIILIISFLTLSLVQGQESNSAIQESNSAIVSYKVSRIKSYIKKSTNDSKASLEVMKRINKDIKNAKDVYATLTFNSKESSYQVDRILEKDNESFNLTYFFAGANHYYYFSKGDNQLVKQSNTLGETFIISYKPVNWLILNERKVIGDYLCIKAVKKNDESKLKQGNVVAWFSPEIPVNFGPSKFHGLPGLIIELEFANINFKVESIKWTAKEIEIEKPLKGKKVTFEEFRAIAKKVNPAFFNN